MKNLIKQAERGFRRISSTHKQEKLKRGSKHSPGQKDEIMTGVCEEKAGLLTAVGRDFQRADSPTLHLDDSGGAWDLETIEDDPAVLEEEEPSSAEFFEFIVDEEQQQAAVVQVEANDEYYEEEFYEEEFIEEELIEEEIIYEEEIESEHQAHLDNQKSLDSHLVLQLNDHQSVGSGITLFSNDTDIISLGSLQKCSPRTTRKKRRRKEVKQKNKEDISDCDPRPNEKLSIFRHSKLIAQRSGLDTLETTDKMILHFVDCFLESIDCESSKSLPLKEIYESVESQLSITPNKTQRKLIRDRLREMFVLKIMESRDNDH